MNTPLHIVMTPVRNEAWVLRAFLESTSLWADYIIIADQMSTDGSREIARSFEKVILIDNKNPEFNEAERQAMLVKEARKVAAGRDTLLWGLDADEVLSANAFETEDWKHIINSVPGDVFWFKWAEICPDLKNIYTNVPYYPWLFHDDGKEPHGNYVRNMHSMRIPFPKEEKQMYYVNDFRVLHLASLNPYRVASKSRFYQFVDWELNHRSPVELSRCYVRDRKDDPVEALPNSFLYERPRYDFDLIELVDRDVKVCYMDEYVVERMQRHPIKELRKLDLWDESFIDTYHLNDPRKPLDKLLHRYFQLSRLKSDCFWVRAIDKVLKLFV